MLAAAFICVFIGLRLRKRLPGKLFALSALIVIGLLGNNLITGVISVPDARFQSRIIWLVPMLFVLFILVWADEKRKIRIMGKHIYATNTLQSSCFIHFRKGKIITMSFPL